jgi:heme/copper-type cytochrome/quinol oxidase subunit 2
MTPLGWFFAGVAAMVAVELIVSGLFFAFVFEADRRRRVRRTGLPKWEG